MAINGRTAEAVEAVVAGIEGAVAAPFDVTDEAAVARAVEALGPVDVLVNNTGITIRRELVELETDEWRRMLDVNLTERVPRRARGRAGDDRARPRARSSTSAR